MALACKPTAALALPLVLVLGLVSVTTRSVAARSTLRRLGNFVLPLAIGVGLLALWDLARAPRSFYTLAVARNDPGRLIRADELWPRLEAWADRLSTAVGSQALAAALSLLVLLWLIGGLRRGRSRTAALDWSIIGFALAFLGWYWQVAFNTYDRYLHPLTPFLLLLAAHAAIGLWRRAGARPVMLAAGAAIVAAGLLPSTLRTLDGDTPLIDSQSEYAGIDHLAQYLKMDLRGEVVYDHWLGWELAYYLGDDPGVVVVYMPLPDDLADDMRGQSASRYFAAPSAVEAGPWLAALDRAGIDVQTVYTDPPHGFVVYALAAP